MTSEEVPESFFDGDFVLFWSCRNIIVLDV